MKKFLFIAALAALAVVSCKQDPVSNETPADMTPLTLTVSYDEPIVRTALGEDGLSVNWTKDDAIGVFDGVAMAPNKFTANSEGATSSFSGEVAASSEKLVVFYPYNASATCDMNAGTESGGAVTTEIPAVQTPVKGSFDPKAAVSAAKKPLNTDDAVLFRNFFALLKVDVDIEGIASIQISNTSRDFAGGVILDVYNGGISGTGTTSRTVTLKNPDDSAIEKGIYYIVIRACTEANPYKDFTMTVSTVDGKSGSRSAKNTLAIGRNTVKDIGKVSSIKTTTSRYAQYMAGEDIVVGGHVVNKKTNGDAELLNAATANTAVSKTSLNEGGVFFLSADQGASFFSEWSPTPEGKDIWFISDSGEKVTVTFKQAMNFRGVSLYMKDIIIDQRGEFGTVISNGGSTTTDIKDLVFDNCEIKNFTKAFISANSKINTCGINNISFTKCKIAVGSAVPLVQVPGDVTISEPYKTFTFEDNIVYSTTGDNIASKVFAYNCKNIIEEQQYPMVVNFNRNILYNFVVNGGTFTHQKISSFTGKNNLFWICEYDGDTHKAEAGGNAKFISIKAVIPTTDVTGNGVYGTPYKAGVAQSWRTADTDYMGTMQKLQDNILPEDPFETADITTGTFKVKTAYSSYGPQL